ncbi:MAG TPA: ThiF family adenylyltransferase [Phycisphaerae bacterium]|nr:ThiF family adenylyltransferase [Phycisphaerae bacterium]
MNTQPQSRYSRQILYEHFGPAAQEKLRAARVTLIGCGALGTVLANTLARAGVGLLRIVDRDFVELNNLQRQVLFDEQDVRDGTPKAVAAAAALAKINSEIAIEPVVADAHPGNIEVFADGANVILDGTDNFETRYLINDTAVKHAIPWVYGACVSAEGMVMPILPGETPCLRCIFDEPPPAGASPTCDTVGVLAPIVQVVASLQAMEAMKILIGRKDALNRKLLQINVWTGAFTAFDMQPALDGGECDCCKERNFIYLKGSATGRTVSLCGRDAVQVRPASDIRIVLEDVLARVAPAARSAPRLNRYLLRFEVDDYEITLFRGGRAIIKGVSSAEEGKTIYARYIGV